MYAVNTQIDMLPHAHYQPIHTQMCTCVYKHIYIYTVYSYVCSLNKNRRAAVRTPPTSTHTNVNF